METIINRGLENLELDIKYSPERFLEFQKLLLDYNEKTDLTNITDPEDIAIKHFLDSMTIFMVPELKNSGKIIDVGTGAGFPAIPIRLVNPNLDITLLDSLNKRLIFLDSLNKRLIFLDYIIDKMGLENISTLHMRGEDAGRDKSHRQAYDIVVSRAVARLNILVELCLPLVKVGGIMVAMKGRDGDQELEEAKVAIELLGGKVRDVYDFDLWDGDNRRCIIVIEKIKNTHNKYPRNFGQIKKRPL